MLQNFYKDFRGNKGEFKINGHFNKKLIQPLKIEPVYINGITIHCKHVLHQLFDGWGIIKV